MTRLRICDEAACLRPCRRDAKAVALLPLPVVAGEGACAWLERVVDGLLVTFEVDDARVVVCPDQPLWSGSCVEFYADLRPYRERMLLNRYDRGVFQVVVRPSTSEHPAAWTMKSLGLPVPEGMMVSVAPRPAGYEAQLFIPEASCRLVHGPFRSRIHVDVAVQRVHQEGRTAKIFWRGGPDDWQFPHGFGEVVVPRDFQF